MTFDVLTFDGQTRQTSNVMQSHRSFAPSLLRTGAPLGLIALVCAVASVTIWLGPGILNTRGGGDSPFLLIRTYELVENLRAGNIPARWMPDAAYGLGYPFFNYYASLPYYLAAGLNALGVDLLIAIKFTQTAGMFAAGFGMWLFARDSPPPFEGRGWGAALAACAYVLAPFHLVNVYVRGDSLSEFWAFVWYPLVLWAVKRVTRQASGAWRVARGQAPLPRHLLLSTSTLSAFLAALVLTHNVSAVLFAPFIVIYALALLLQKHRFFRAAAPSLLRDICFLLFAAGIALALSAWFWLPALGEATSAQLGEQTTGYFNYANHFRSANLVQSSLVANYAVNDSGDAFAMGLVQALLVACGIIACGVATFRAYRAYTSVIPANARNQAAPPTFNFVLISALFVLATFMLTPASAFIWEHAPLLKLAQFPWRMLSVQAVFASVLIGTISDFRFQISDLPQSAPISQSIENPKSEIANRPMAVALLATLVLIYAALVGLPNERLNIHASDVTPHTIQLYEWYTSNIGTTIRAEYLPSTVQPRPYVGPALLGYKPQARIAQDGVPPDALSSELVSRTPTQQVWMVGATQAVSIVLPMIYTPAWQAQLDALPVAISPHDGSGWVTVRAPQGQHQLLLTHVGTPLQRIGDIVALGALLILAGFVIVILLRLPATVRRSVIGVALFMLLALIAIRLHSAVLPQPTSASPMQALDFQARPFPHRGPIVFEGNGQRYELVGAMVTPPELKSGDPFTLTLQWRDGKRPPMIEVMQETPMGGEFAALFRSGRLVSVQTGDVSAHQTVSGVLPGPQLLKLTTKDGEIELIARDPDGNALTTLIGGKWTPGATLLGPTVTETPPNAPSTTLVTFGNGIALNRMDWFFASANNVCFRPVWSRGRADMNRADALQVSLRLRGHDGRLVAQADNQPQSGLMPTWAWPDRTLIPDSQCVQTQGLLDAGEAYTLDIVWYRLKTFVQTGDATLRGTRGPGLNDLNEPR
jgi:hypothetical protein